MHGYGVDIIHALERTDKNIQFIGYEDFCTIPRIETDLVAGDNDVFVSAFKSTSREKLFRIPDIPVHTFRLVMVVRKNDDVKASSFEDIRALKGDNVILTLFGSGLRKFLDEQKGLQVDSSATTIEANLRKLQNGHGRFFFTVDLGLEKFLNTPLWKEKFTLLPTAFKEESQYFLISKKLPEKNADVLINALKQLKSSGELERIFQTYSYKE